MLLAILTIATHGFSILKATCDDSSAVASRRNFGAKLVSVGAFLVTPFVLQPETALSQGKHTDIR